MSSRDLEVKMKIDRSQAAQAISQHDAQLEASKRRALEHYLAVNRATKETGAALAETGKQGSTAFAGINASSLIAVAGLSKALEVAKLIGDAIREAHERARRFANDFVQQRDALRELSMVMGKPLNDQFVMENARFNQDARMKPGEGLAFRSSFFGSAAQYAGKTMTDAEFAQYERQAAQLSTLSGIDPKVSGDFMGQMAGMLDYRKFGDKASENALGVANQSFQILSRGRGLNSKNVEELGKINSAIFSQNEKLGVVNDPSQTATLISLAAEYNANESALPTIDAISELRKKGGKAEPLIRAAGLKGNEQPLEVIERITPIIQKEMERTGEDLDQVLSRYFEERATRLMATFINKGVIGKGFADRLDWGKQFAGPEAPLKAIEEFTKNETGRFREVEAQGVGIDLQKGQSQATLELLRRDAENRLRARGELDTPEADKRLAMQSWNPLNIGYDQRQKDIDQEVRKLLASQMPESLINSNLDTYQQNRWNHWGFGGQGNQGIFATDEDAMLTKLIGVANKNGIDLVSASGSKSEETNRLLRQVVSELQRANNRTEALPRPVPPAPNPGRR